MFSASRTLLHESGERKRTVKQSTRKKRCLTMLVKCKRKRRKESKEEGKRIKCSGGRRSYSRLLSPFHLQLPLFLPEPSPGTQTPLSTSASTTSNRRGIRPLVMPASESCIGATAESRGPWGVLSHTQSCLTQLYGEIQNNNNTSSSCSASLGALALGHDTEAPEGSHTHRRHPSSSWGIGIILLRASQTDCNSSIGRQAK